VFAAQLEIKSTDILRKAAEALCNKYDISGQFWKEKIASIAKEVVDVKLES
jgi:hypothetical protein